MKKAWFFVEIRRKGKVIKRGLVKLLPGEVGLEIQALAYAHRLPFRGIKVKAL